ncbi:hypothetical protein [Neorhizobium sp. NCHU2750]|uniref:hypothetical protein n=1 Tax=Neorhizobium sp. NCHU2750 TaxID=1825976 RepID=UPI000E75EFB4|nr:hypothetical protein NCHU2750_23410 [Neorhizobium sp. NCHU2750]
MTFTIQTVSGHIGAGKSRSFHHWFGELVQENGGKPIPTTVATPTNRLSLQHHGYFQNEGIASAVISQEEGYRSASEEYLRRVEEGDESVLLVNHSVALETKTGKENRLLVVDEYFVPMSTIFIEFEKPEDVADFVVTDAHKPGYYELIGGEHAVRLGVDVKDEDGVKYRKYGKKARELAEFTLNEHYLVVIDKESFDKAVSGEAFQPDANGKTPRVFLQFTIFMLPSIVQGFKDVLMIGANRNTTLLYKMWTKDGVVFEANKSMEDRLDYSDLHHKAQLAKVYHPPLPNLSKTFLKRLGNTNEELGQQTFLDIVSDGIADRFGEQPHIFCTNKHKHSDKEYGWKLEGKGGKRVITNPNGWNDLQDYDMAVFMAAINYDPETIQRLWDFYEIDNKAAKEALCYELVYQFLGRTSLRDFKSENEVILIVPDAGAAANICALIGCGEPIPLDIDFGIEARKAGRPRVEKTAEQKKEETRQRVALHRAKKKAEAAAQLAV